MLQHNRNLPDPRSCLSMTYAPQEQRTCRENGQERERRGLGHDRQAVDGEVGAGVDGLARTAIPEAVGLWEMRAPAANVAPSFAAAHAIGTL
jgi:hypothetical protein